MTTMPTETPKPRPYAVSPEPEGDVSIFVDHSLTGRSGHVGHAMFQNLRGDIHAFYANCAGEPNGGHNAIGWMESRVSKDGGESWSEGAALEISKTVFEEGKGRSLFTEKALVTDQGTVLLFFLVSDISSDPTWDPWLVPLVARSDDHGATWSAPVALGGERGRVFDVNFVRGESYALTLCGNAMPDERGRWPELIYKLLVSGDDGLTFTERSVLPFSTRDRCYGALGTLQSGALIAYAYNRQDEYNLDFCTSEDGGRTWSVPSTAFFAKRLRNPQFVSLRGHYFLHGRSGSHGDEGARGNFVLYHSLDGLNWDDGTYLVRRTHGFGAYSNSLVVTDPRTGIERIRIQGSHAYENHRTNVLSWWLDVN